jgi:hypothetical protein
VNKLRRKPRKTADFPPFFVVIFRLATPGFIPRRTPIFFDKGCAEMRVFSVFLRKKTW